MVLAGFAFTIITLPKTSRLPAFVAGFKRVFTMHKPGSTNFPTFFTCCVATSAKLVITLAHSDFFNSVSEAKASAMAPLLKAFAPAFIAFIAFMAFMAFMAFIGAIRLDWMGSQSGPHQGGS